MNNQNLSPPSHQDEKNLEKQISPLIQDHQQATNDINTRQFLVNWEALEYVKDHVHNDTKPMDQLQTIDLGIYTTPPNRTPTFINNIVSNIKEQASPKRLAQAQWTKDQMIHSVNHASQATTLNNNFIQRALSKIKADKTDVMDHLSHVQFQHVLNLEQI